MRSVTNAMTGHFSSLWKFYEISGLDTRRCLSILWYVLLGLDAIWQLLVNLRWHNLVSNSDTIIYILTGLSTMGYQSDMIIIRAILYLQLCSDPLITNQWSALLYRIWVSCEVFHIQNQGWSWSELQLDPYWYRQTNHLTDPTKWPPTRADRKTFFMIFDHFVNFVPFASV